MSTSMENESTPLINHRATILGVTLSFQVLAFFAVVLRLYTRFRILKTPGWDDLLIVAAMICILFGSISISLATNYGLGKHISDLSQNEITHYLKYFYLMNAAYVLSTGFIKLSILHQYLRTFDERIVRRISMGVFVFTALWLFAFGFLALFPCFPVHAYWNVSVTNATCYAYGAKNVHIFVGTFIAQGGLDVLLDFVIYLIPIPIFIRQKLSKRERLCFFALLTIGLIVCILSSYRLATLIAVRHETDSDWSWYSPTADVMSTLEVNIAAVAASVPIFWPVLEAGLGVISITHEVEVTHQYRRHHDSELELAHGDSSQKSGSSETDLHRQTSDLSQRDTYINFQPVDGTKIWATKNGERPL